MERDALRALERKVLWLAVWMIHHANHLRAKEDGLKVGGHQASSASVVTLMTALYFDVLRAWDRVAVKPHASPVFHAIQYLLGRQTRDQIERFRIELEAASGTGERHPEFLVELIQRHEISTALEPQLVETARAKEFPGVDGGIVVGWDTHKLARQRIFGSRDKATRSRASFRPPSEPHRPDSASRNRK